jgi:uncharacterized membrane protein (DUF373 family)
MPDSRQIIDILEKYEKVIYILLAVMPSVVIAFSVGMLAFTVFKGLAEESVLLLENHGILNIFGLFLLVLIGIELLGTVKAYIKDREIHVEVVIILATIAIARKVILLDLSQTTDLTLVGIGVIIIALTAGYYFIRKAGTAD